MKLKTKLINVIEIKPYLSSYIFLVLPFIYIFIKKERRYKIFLKGDIVQEVYVRGVTYVTHTEMTWDIKLKDMWDN